MDKEEFGKKMKAHRDKFKYTLMDLQSLTGINQGYLSKLENGKNKPSLETIYKLNSVLKFDDESMVIEGYNLNRINIGNEGETDERIEELMKLLTLYKGRGNATINETIGLLEIIEDIIKNE